MGDMNVDSGYVLPPYNSHFWNTNPQSSYHHSNFPQSTIEWGTGTMASSSASPDLDYASFSAQSCQESSPASTTSPAGSFDGDMPHLFKSDEPVATEPTPKRRRKSQPSKNATAKSAASVITQPSATPSATRAERKRERNRVAATKCREKARAETSILTEREGQLSKQREDLIKSIAMLKEEVYGLEQLCFSHINCDCARIRGYLLSKLNRPGLNPESFAPEAAPLELPHAFEDNTFLDLIHFA